MNDKTSDSSNKPALIQKCESHQQRVMLCFEEAMSKDKSNDPMTGLIQCKVLYHLKFTSQLSIAPV